MGASPGAAVALTRMNTLVDIRPVLEAIHVPTLVIHRTGRVLATALAAAVGQEVTWFRGTLARKGPASFAAAFDVPGAPDAPGPWAYAR